jgi:hypothetical protein
MKKKKERNSPGGSVDFSGDDVSDKSISRKKNMGKFN